MRRLLCSAAAAACLFASPAAAVVTGTFSLMEGVGGSCGATGGGVSDPVTLSLDAGGDCSVDSSATFTAVDATYDADEGTGEGAIGLAIEDVEGGPDTTAAADTTLQTRFKVVEVAGEAAVEAKAKREKNKKRLRDEAELKKAAQKKLEEQQAREKEALAQKVKLATQKVKNQKKAKLDAAQQKYDAEKQEKGEEHPDAKAAKDVRDQAKKEFDDAEKALSEALEKEKAATRKLKLAETAKKKAQKKAKAVAEKKGESKTKTKAAKKEAGPIPAKVSAETAVFSVLVDGVIGFTAAGQTGAGWLEVSFDGGATVDRADLFTLGAACDPSLDVFCEVTAAGVDPFEFGARSYDFEFGYNFDAPIDFSVGLHLTASEGVGLLFDQTAALSFALAADRDIVELDGDLLRATPFNVVPAPAGVWLLLSGFGVAAAMRRRARA